MVKNKIIRARAPLRIGLAGGGTDVSPFSDIYGGAILNTTISLFAYATIEPRTDGKIVLIADDLNERIVFTSTKELEIDGTLDLLKGVYNRIVSDFSTDKLSFTLTTMVDVPPGSGLGSSSTLVVAIVGAFVKWLNLPLGEYDIAYLAYLVERVDLGLAGGKQDQYAATFGGFNFMEFHANDRVIINPLRIPAEIIDELQYCLLLYYTGQSRLSSEIIERQIESMENKDRNRLESLNAVKEQATMLKKALLACKINALGEILDFGWKHKKLTADGVTTKKIERIYEIAIAAGATGGKVSGAGGGGFMILYCPHNTKGKVSRTIRQKFEGNFLSYQFVKRGLETWMI